MKEGTVTAPQLPFPRPDVLSIGPLYAQLRATAPICAVRTPAGDPAWLVTSHALTRELLADPRLGRSHPDPKRAARISAWALLGGPMGDAANEAESHAQMRKMWPRRSRPGGSTPAPRARRRPRRRGAGPDGRARRASRPARAGVAAHPGAGHLRAAGVPYADRDRFRALSEGVGAPPTARCRCARSTTWSRTSASSCPASAARPPRTSCPTSWPIRKAAMTTGPRCWPRCCSSRATRRP